MLRNGSICAHPDVPAICRLHCDSLYLIRDIHFYTTTTSHIFECGNNDCELVTWIWLRSFQPSLLSGAVCMILLFIILFGKTIMIRSRSYFRPRSMDGASKNLMKIGLPANNFPTVLQSPSSSIVPRRWRPLPRAAYCVRRPQPAGGFPEKSVDSSPESSAVYSVFS